MSSSRRLLLTGLLAGLPLLAPAATAQEGAPSMQQATRAMQNGHFEQAATSFRKILEAQPDNGIAWFNLGYSLHALGKLEEAHDCHVKAQDTPQVRTIAIYNHACVHSLWGETDSAIRLLKDAVAEGFGEAQQLRTDPDLDNIRQDPRFQAILTGLEGPALPPVPPRVPEPPTRRAKPVEPKGSAAPGKPVKPFRPAKVKAAKAVAPEKAFDFYPGEWDVLADGELVSHLKVRRLLDGAAIEAVSENSVGLYRWDGKSGKWRQTWIGREGMSAELVGNLHDGRIVMRMKGSFDDQGTLGRSVFSDIGRNGFNYHWEISSDGGKTWTGQQPLRFQRAGAKVRRQPAGHAAPAAAHHADTHRDTVLSAAQGYDFKLGKWRIEGKVMTADGSDAPCTGKAVAVRKEDGTIYEKIVISVEDGPTYIGSSERRYDAESGKWRVSWKLSEPEQVSMDLVGKLKDGAMVEYGGDGEDATGTYSNRVTFLDLTQDSYSARQDRLYDDGRFVVGVWTYTATRSD